MYSNPSSERMYYTLSGPDGKGLPIQTLTGTTDPKIGKIYRTKVAELKKKYKDRLGAPHLTKEQKAAIEQQMNEEDLANRQEMLARFRREAIELGNEKALPEKLQLNQIFIEYKGGQIVETPTVFAKEK